MNISIILASGSGERFAGDIPKQFIKLAGLPVIVHTLKEFQKNSLIDKIIVVTNKEYIDDVWGYIRRYNLSKVEKVLIGGKTRQESSFVGLNSCNDKDYVIIHDAVRPFVTQKIINDVVNAAIKYNAVDTAIPSADTIIKIDDNNFIKEIPNRSFLRRGQTPQGFKFNLIKEAHLKAIKDGITNSTDDCSLVLRMGIPVYVVDGDEQNIKITYPIDLHIADKLFQLRTSQNNTSDLGGLRDKVVVVFGGTSGIGLETAKLAESLGAKAEGFSRKTNPKVDVTEFKSLTKTFEYVLRKHKRIDIVINCAGDLLRKDTIFMDEKEWDYIYNVNVKSNFLITKAIVPIFKKQGHGSLIFIGSSSYTRGRAEYSAYSSSKAALVNFMQAVSEELEQFNINVNLINPGRTATPLRFRNFGNENPSTLLDPKQVAEEILKVAVQKVTGCVFEVR